MLLILTVSLMKKTIAAPLQIIFFYNGWYQGCSDFQNILLLDMLDQYFTVLCRFHSSPTAPYCNIFTAVGQENIKLLEPSVDGTLVAHNDRRIEVLQNKLQEL
jgi:hypothetical protein